MKYVIFLPLTLMMFLLVSCSTNVLEKQRETNLIGLWQTQRVQENFKNEDNSLNAAIEDAKITIYEFNENMTAEIRVRNITNKINWDLNGDLLVLKREDQQIKFNIVELSSTKMILVSKYPNGELKYYLSKIENQ